MWIAAAEMFCWALIGLSLGFAGHWWKSNADPYPDILDKDNPALNIALTEYSVENYALSHRYDEAGYWEYYKPDEPALLPDRRRRRHVARRVCHQRGSCGREGEPLRRRAVRRIRSGVLTLSF